MSSGAHLRGLAPGQHGSEDASQRWRAIDGTVSDFSGLGIEPQASRTGSHVLNKITTELTVRTRNKCVGTEN